MRISCLHKKTIDDPNNGEIVCSKCGVVLESRTSNEADHGVYTTINGNYLGHHGDQNKYSATLTTEIGRENTSADGRKLNNTQKIHFKKLRYQNKRLHTSREYTQYKHKNRIYAYTEQLELPDHIAKEAIRIFNLRQNKAGYILSEYSAACIYLACRKAGVYVQQSKIIEKLNLKKKRFRRFIRKLVTQFDIKRTQTNADETYLILERLHSEFNSNTTTRIKSKQILERLQANKFSFMMPRSTAAAVFYHIRNGEVTQFDVAEQCGICMLTLRTNLNKIKEAIN